MGMTVEEAQAEYEKYRDLANRYYDLWRSVMWEKTGRAERAHRLYFEYVATADALAYALGHYGVDVTTNEGMRHDR